MAKRERVTTKWACYTYDVWGNEKDGFEVNDRFNIGTVELDLDVELNNPGRPGEFKSAYPSTKQIRESLDIKPRVKLDLDGDDLVIYVNHASTGYPLGEMHCESHVSLSPIRKIEEKRNLCPVCLDSDCETKSLDCGK